MYMDFVPLQNIITGKIRVTIYYIVNQLSIKLLRHICTIAQSCTNDAQLYIMSNYIGKSTYISSTSKFLLPPLTTMASSLCQSGEPSLAKRQGHC